MNKLAFFIFLFSVVSIFGETFILDNQTPYPGRSTESTIELQWAASPQEMSAKNIESIYQLERPSNTMLLVSGENKVSIPHEQKYFRILIWEKGKAAPTYVSSWVLVISNKAYTLKNDDLYYSVLNAGSGC